MNEEHTQDEQLEEVQAAKPSTDEVDYKDQLMRCLADYDNLKKEMVSKQQEWSEYASKSLLRDLIPVIEHFKTGLRYIPEEYKKADWLIGFMQIEKQLQEFMAKNGLEEVKTIGEKFNPEEHEAIGVKASDQASDTVIEEISTGFKLKGKVLKPARVIVSE